MYKCIITNHFKRQLKVYLKKFRHIFPEIIKNLSYFNKNEAISLGKRVYKIRLSVSKLKKGKNKSFGMIVYLLEDDGVIIPIAIYLKNRITNLKSKEVKRHLKKVFYELEI